jgi:MATE family multidrug resistance protein
MQRPTRADFRAVLSLAVPVVLTQLGLMAMGTVDTIMMGRVSEEALAATALGNLYFYTVSLFGLGTLMVLDPVISQAVGAGDETGIALGAQRGMLIAIVIAIIGSFALLLAGPALTLLRQPPAVVAIASDYCTVSIPGLLPFFTFQVLKQTLQAMNRVREVVVTMVIANVVNALLNLVLIFGVDALGIPAMGAVGSAASTAIARWVMFLLLLRLAWPSLVPYLRPVRDAALARRPLLAMAAMGAPIGTQFMLEAGAFNAIAILMGWLGTTALAGHEIALNIASLTFMVPMGMGAAAATLVGQAIGAGDAARARRAASASLACGVGFMVLSAAVLLSVPHLLARAFTTEVGAAAMAATLIPLAGIFQVFDGTQVVSAGVLRGIGDTQAPVAVNLLGFWLLGVPTSLWLGFGRGMGAPGLWWGLVVGLAAVAAFLLVRVRVRFGREVRRVVV